MAPPATPDPRGHNKDGWMEWFLPTTRHEANASNASSSSHQGAAATATAATAAAANDSSSSNQSSSNSGTGPLPVSTLSSSSSSGATSGSARVGQPLVAPVTRPNEPLGSLPGQPTRSWRWSTWSGTFLLGATGSTRRAAAPVAELPHLPHLPQLPGGESTRRRPRPPHAPNADRPPHYRQSYPPCTSRRTANASNATTTATTTRRVVPAADPRHASPKRRSHRMARRQNLAGIWTSIVARSSASSSRASSSPGTVNSRSAVEMSTTTSSDGQSSVGNGRNRRQTGRRPLSHPHPSPQSHRHSYSSNSSSNRTHGAGSTRAPIPPTQRRSIFSSTGGSHRGQWQQTARSSMVLQLNDDDIASMYIPEILHDSADDEWPPMTASRRGSYPYAQQPPLLFPPQNATNASVTASGAATTRAYDHPDLERGTESIIHHEDDDDNDNDNEAQSTGWFSNWIVNHPRKKKKKARASTSAAAAAYSHSNVSHVTNPSSNGTASYRHSSYSHPNSSAGFHGNESNSSGSKRRRNKKVHPGIIYDDHGLDDYLRATDDDHHHDNNKHDAPGGTSNSRTRHKMLPLMQYPTLSDLSSLTSSNASDNRLHLQGTSPAATQSHASPLVSRRQHHMRLLALAKKEPLESTEKQSQAISPPTTVRRRRKRGHRFSVVWKSQSGKTGKRVVHVDEKGHVIHHRPLAVWDDCDHDTSGRILATLFMLGFLFCPCWWAGAFLFLTRRDYFALDVQILYLWTPRTFGHLNVCLSVASLVLMALLTGLAVWYHAVMA